MAPVPVAQRPITSEPDLGAPLGLDGLLDARAHVESRNAAPKDRRRGPWRCGSSVASISSALPLDDDVWPDRPEIGWTVDRGPITAASPREEAAVVGTGRWVRQFSAKTGPCARQCEVAWCYRRARKVRVALAPLSISACFWAVVTPKSVARNPRSSITTLRRTSSALRL